MHDFSCWPKPILTEEEGKNAAIYREVLPNGTVKQGIERRIYPFQLIRTTFPGEQSVLTVNYVTSGQRTLLHAITFSGDIEFWNVTCRTLSGQNLFADASVASLLNLPKINGAVTPTISGLPGTDTTWPFALLRPNGGPLVYDPPWVLDGSQALTLTGATRADSGFETGAAQYISGANSRGVLWVAFHVWEIPGYGGVRGPRPPSPRLPGKPAVPSGVLR